MGKIFTAMGLMSGTSLDGVDVSIIESDGVKEFSSILDRYFEYDKKLIQKILILRDKITIPEHLDKYSDEINDLERKITLFHADAINKTLETSKSLVDLIGFHGQTIYHNPLKKISKQIGDGNLLSQLSKKTIIYNFRKNDLQNGGEGAPLTPVFHKLIVKQNRIELPVCILNIGGITNVTLIDDYDQDSFLSRDLGPGNCLIDEWIRNKTKKKFDKNGDIAKRGKINNLIVNQALDNFENKFKQKTLSFDTKDFSLGFVRGLDLDDGAATLTEFTARIISMELSSFLQEVKNNSFRILVCGGGRKNTNLLERIKSLTPKNLVVERVDDYGIDGDYIESQAFAYLAIRSFLKLPISYPSTTGCLKPTTGGVITKNF